jgi:hypothetical protein
MLGGVQAEGEQGIFGGEAGDVRIVVCAQRDAAGAGPEIVELKLFGIDGVEIREERPLQLDEIFTAGAVKGSLVSSFEPETLDGWSMEFGRLVVDFRKGDFGLVKIGRRNQKVEVGKIAQGQVAVGGLRQDWSLVGNCAYALLREMLRDPQ